MFPNIFYPVTIYLYFSGGNMDGQIAAAPTGFKTSIYLAAKLVIKANDIPNVQRLFFRSEKNKNGSIFEFSVWLIR